MRLSIPLRLHPAEARRTTSIARARREARLRCAAVSDHRFARTSATLLELLISDNRCCGAAVVARGISALLPPFAFRLCGFRDIRSQTAQAGCKARLILRSATLHQPRLLDLEEGL